MISKLAELLKSLNIDNSYALAKGFATIGFGENVVIRCDQVGNKIYLDAPIYVVPYNTNERLKKFEMVLIRSTENIAKLNDIIYLDDDECVVRVACQLTTNNENISSTKTELLEFAERVEEWVDFTQDNQLSIQTANLSNLTIKL